MFDSLRPHGLLPASLPCLWDFPGESIGVGCHLFSPRDLPDPGIKPASLALAGGFFYRCATGMPIYIDILCFYCASLYCTSQILYFSQINVCGSPTSNKSISIIFQTAFAHFVPLSHFGNSYSFSEAFINIIFVMVIFYQWS